ncbi:DUF3334 family protein, partial [Enterovibrio norvegicus]
QIVGDFTGKIKRSLHTNITQNQPKMMAINKNINVTIDSNIERPQARRVSFDTEDNNIFYLELSMERTEFIQLEEFEEGEEVNPDAILETEILKQLEGKDVSKKKKSAASDSNSLMDDLGI